ncbi:MAG: hypothetical protein IKE60_04250 [Reyranella sp.]|jgi:hypothetical protein|uniref:hypothetical protein n=1 Tax=Reyranella sp. TaxID=1929291 RepID=UPI0025FFC97D|nr:hypothetical protein [Reyranella sp.]MBR2813836.1 hypothetical protein [Reyranella sp.]
MKHLPRWVPLSLIAFDAMVATSMPAIAQPAHPTATQTTEQLKARCSQLLAYYDRFGASRGVHTDGRRNSTRMDAEVDCTRGLYAEGISTLEDLFRRKKFTPPPAGLPNEPEDDD